MNNTESINEKNIEEQKVVDDILNTLDEGVFGDVLDKIKSYAKKGLMTAAILGSLLSAPQFSQAQKQQIKQAANTEMSSTQKKIAEDFAKLIFTNKEKKDWSESIPSCCEGSEVVLDSPRKDKLEELCNEHEVDLFNAAILNFSQSNG